MADQTIWKYELKLRDIQAMYVPEKGKILSVANQGNTLCMWIQVNPAAPKTRRDIVIVGTGNSISNPDQLEFVGTVLMPPFVWHVFEQVIPCT